MCLRMLRGDQGGVSALVSASAQAQEAGRQSESALKDRAACAHSRRACRPESQRLSGLARFSFLHVPVLLVGLVEILLDIAHAFLDLAFDLLRAALDLLVCVARRLAELPLNLPGHVLGRALQLIAIHGISY